MVSLILQEHRQPFVYQQNCGRLLRVGQLRNVVGACSGPAHPVLQPERKPGHPSHKSCWHTLHPAPPQVQTLHHHRVHVNVALIKHKPFYAPARPTSCRPHDYSSEGFNDWAFMTTHSWDENPNGAWTLEIENVAGASDYGKTALVLLPYFSL